MREKNPIEKSIDWLAERGWTPDEAKNLLRALKSDESPEHLWRIAPKWIEHCGESLYYARQVLGTVALGLVDVRAGENGEWLFALNAKGIEAGKAVGFK